LSTYIGICVDLQQTDAFAGLVAVAPLALVYGNPILANSGEYLGLTSVQERIELNAEDLVVMVLADVGAAMFQGCKAHKSSYPKGISPVLVQRLDHFRSLNPSAQAVQLPCVRRFASGGGCSRAEQTGGVIPIDGVDFVLILLFQKIAGTRGVIAQKCLWRRLG